MFRDHFGHYWVSSDNTVDSETSEISAVSDDSVVQEERSSPVD